MSSYVASWVDLEVFFLWLQTNCHLTLHFTSLDDILKNTVSVTSAAVLQQPQTCRCTVNTAWQLSSLYYRRKSCA